MNRKLLVLLLLSASCLALTWPIGAAGQVLKGSISGTVVDPQGAVVANAQVKATHVATGTVLNTRSDGAGLFRFNLIPTGTYMVEISGQGFSTTQTLQPSFQASIQREIPTSVPDLALPI